MQMTLSFTDIVKKFRLKNQASSTMKIEEVLNQNEISTKIYIRDSEVQAKVSIVNLNPFNGTHSMAYIHGQKN